MSALLPQGGNDRIYTPPELARRIVQHFKPSGRILDPCAGRIGNQPFVSALVDYMAEPRVSWCEIDEGLDFFDLQAEYFDWIITNPPWSKLTAFIEHGMHRADNVVYLCLTNAWYQKARERSLARAGFGIVEHATVLDKIPKPWPQAGLSLSATWIRRGWTGSTHRRVLP